MYGVGKINYEPCEPRHGICTGGWQPETIPGNGNGSLEMEVDPLAMEYDPAVTVEATGFFHQK